MADELLPEGLRFFNKKENQPDFVIGALVITMNDLFAFCKAHPELITEYNGAKQLKLQVLKSSKGNLYAKVDTWKPAEQPAGNMAAPVLPDVDSSLPF
jgi:hypothetical protein